MGRRAVVSYAVDASDAGKARALLGGLRECVIELVELETDPRKIVEELEQLANDVEDGDVCII